MWHPSMLLDARECEHDCGITYSGHCPMCGTFVADDNVVDLGAYRQARAS